MPPWIKNTFEARNRIVKLVVITAAAAAGSGSLHDAAFWPDACAYRPRRPLRCPRQGRTRRQRLPAGNASTADQHSAGRQPACDCSRRRAAPTRRAQPPGDPGHRAGHRHRRCRLGGGRARRPAQHRMADGRQRGRPPPQQRPTRRAGQRGALRAPQHQGRGVPPHQRAGTDRRRHDLSLRRPGPAPHLPGERGHGAVVGGGRQRGAAPGQRPLHPAHQRRAA